MLQNISDVAHVQVRVHDELEATGGLIEVKLVLAGLEVEKPILAGHMLRKLTDIIQMQMRTGHPIIKLFAVNVTITSISSCAYPLE